MRPEDYGPPLDKLLTQKDQPAAGGIKTWPDYPALFGLGPEHIPDLISMATDHDLSWSEEYEATPEVYWGPLYAWRALGQLHALEAAAPLLAVLDEPENEWAHEDLPDVYALIGPVALPVLAAYSADAQHDIYGRGTALRSLRGIAEAHPDSRGEIIGLLQAQLKQFQTNEILYNSFLISELTGLQAVETLPLIKQVFDARRVDPTFIDWEWIQMRFGLMTEEEYDQGMEARAAANRAALGIPPELVNLWTESNIPGQLPPPGWSPEPARLGRAELPAPARQREPRKVVTPPPDPVAKAKRQLIEQARRKDRKRK